MAGRALGSILISVAATSALALTAGAGEVVKVATVDGRDAPVLRLTLDPEVGKSWSEVYVGRVAVRELGVQRRVPDKSLTDSPILDVELSPETGCSMVLVDLGPESVRGRVDAWRRTTRSTKIVACNDTGKPSEVLAARRQAGVMTMAKVGSRIEIRPAFSPTMMRPGADLPVRIYFDNVAQPGVQVEAHGPEGRRIVVTTDALGFATLRLDAAGAWVLRHRMRQQETDYLAELELEVPTVDFWRRLPISGGAK